MILSEIHKTADEVQFVTESVLQNAGELFESNTQATSILCETAAKYLGLMSAQLGLGNRTELPDFNKAVDMLTALRVIGSSTNRDAFNIKPNAFKVIIQKAGDVANVDNALIKLANNPSVATIRRQIEQLLRAALENVEGKRREAVQLINKLRLGYERVQNTLNSAERRTNATTQADSNGKKAEGSRRAAFVS